MNQSGYKLIGMVVWRGGRWYLRRKLPRTRVIAAWSFAGLFMLIAGTLIARRAGG